MTLNVDRIRINGVERLTPTSFSWYKIKGGAWEERRWRELKVYVLADK
jgi:hypothetical protein